MKYRLLYLLWLFPCYLAFISVQQLNVYRGTIDTYNNGESIAADVLDFDIKQIAAQSNGYVVLNFTTSEGENIEKKLSLSVQMAQQIMDIGVIPIRFQKNTYQEIVMIPVYEIQRSTSLMNMVIAIISTTILSIACTFISRFANKRATEGVNELVIERMDA